MGASIHIADWAVFAGVLLVSLLVGVYQACSGGKQKTSGEYLFGNRKMPFMPVMLSLMVSYLSTNSIIGYAAETYTFGAQYSTGIIGYGLGMFLAAYIFVPLFFPLQLVSVNEYLLLRYESRLVHVLGSILTVGAAINYSGVVFYGSSTAIEAMSGFSARWAIVLSGIICTIYTTIGGIKAVIWTDVFQSIIIFLGVIYAVIAGIIASPGLSEIWSINEKWHRLTFFDFDPDPTKRLNIYGCIFGTALSCAGIFGYIQAGVQRYTSLPTMRQAKLCVYATIPGHVIISVLCAMSGLVVFANYATAGCDPLKAGLIPSPNHILPYFMATAVKTPVLTGLFLSCLVASSLSTASSSLNSSGANTWEDILKYWFPNLTEERKAFWMKVLVAIYGGVATTVAIFITFSGGIINQIVQIVSSCLQGPAAGLFFMGAFAPWINWKGASAGTITGFFFGLWLVIGSFFTNSHWDPLPSPTYNCSAETFQNISTTVSSMMLHASDATTHMDNLGTAAPESVPMSGISKLYSISFMWKREVVAGFTVAVAVIVSAITGFRNRKSVPPHLVHPLIRRFVGKDITKDISEFKDYTNGVTALEDFEKKEKKEREEQSYVTTT